MTGDVKDDERHLERFTCCEFSEEIWKILNEFIVSISKTICHDIWLRKGCDNLIQKIPEILEKAQRESLVTIH